MSRSVVVIIPAYEPPTSFLPFLHALRDATDFHILVVDDGSGEAFAPIFEKIRHTPRCTLLTHTRNRGKGRALKSALRYAEGTFPSDTVYVCADCDGQHAIGDIIAVADMAARSPDALVLGCRDFKKAGVPLRSSFGNRMTSLLFRLLFGMRIKDTQTGLRAFSHARLPLYAFLKGDGFEYEMRMLVLCPVRHIPVKCVDIETRYNTQAEGCSRVSHFSPLTDSVKILGVLFSSVARYTAVSLISAVLDLAVFYFLLRFVFSGSEEELPLLLSTVGARILSSSLNFLLNFKYVFKTKSRGAVWKYYAVWSARLALSYALVLILSIPSPSVSHLTAYKALCDIILSAVGYRIQRAWVFSPPQRKTQPMHS